eukprot:GFKZ01000993.1.p1 GENE.GFKZ01000993.1~~GFKZ01000993.1.p1  ORF type:complete len:493 (-),score=97.74 GFKZ01000993.1:1326-2804(-)
MDAAAEHLHTLAHQHYPPSPPRKPRPVSWRMWLTSRVGAAEAALATVFVGGAALAASPSRRRKRDEDDEILPPLSSTTELTLADAWAAVRRAAAAAMAAFEDTPEHSTRQEERKEGTEDGVQCNDSSQQCEQNAESGAESNAVGGTQIGTASADVPKEYVDGDSDDDNSLAIGAKSMSDITVEETEMATAFLQDSESTSVVPSIRSDNHDRVFEETTNKGGGGEVEGLQREEQLGPGPVSDGDCVGEGELVAQDGCFRGVGRSPEEEAELQSRLSELSNMFNDKFAQNGGADCVARVKQIGDEAIVFMRDSADMDSKMIAELDDAKVILDDALLRLDAAVRSKVNECHPEYAEAAAAACSVIDETKEGMEAGFMEEDGARLLAVFATRICAAVVACLEDKERWTWSERVERLAGIATLGVSQLRTVSSKFADALNGLGGNGRKESPASCVWPVEIEKLNEVAISHLLQCVALAIAALQIEAAEKAQLGSGDA